MRARLALAAAVAAILAAGALVGTGSSVSAQDTTIAHVFVVVDENHGDPARHVLIFRASGQPQPFGMDGQLRDGDGEMPKERITPEDGGPFDVYVIWNHDRLVQVVTTASDADERLRNWAEIDQAATTDINDPVSTKPGTSFVHFDGWHVDLNRYRVNELIRVLRRARDQAFGRDE